MTRRSPFGRALKAFGIGRIALIVWIWRNRSQVVGWLGFLLTIPKRVPAKRSRRALADEARIRLAVTTDPVARRAGVRVENTDGGVAIHGPTAVAPYVRNLGVRAALVDATSTDGSADLETTV